MLWMSYRPIQRSPDRLSQIRVIPITYPFAAVVFLFYRTEYLCPRNPNKRNNDDGSKQSRNRKKKHIHTHRKIIPSRIEPKNRRIMISISPFPAADGACDWLERRRRYPFSPFRSRKKNNTKTAYSSPKPRSRFIVARTERIWDFYSNSERKVCSDRASQIKDNGSKQQKHAYLRRRIGSTISEGGKQWCWGLFAFQIESVSVWIPTILCHGRRRWIEFGWLFSWWSSSSVTGGEKNMWNYQMSGHFLALSWKEKSVPLGSFRRRQRICNMLGFWDAFNSFPTPICVSTGRCCWNCNRWIMITICHRMFLLFEI